MASSINASTSGAGGVITTADNSGVLNLQSGGVTQATVSSTGLSLPTNGTINTANTFGFKNRLINGAMVIAQRSTSNTTATGYQTVDRWSFNATQSNKLTWNQNYASVTPATGFTNYLGMQTGGSAYSVVSTDYFVFQQVIEGSNCSDFAWGTANAKTVTLSFWVYSSLTGTFGGVLQNSGASQNYPFSYTISSANTWEQKSITITGPTSGTWITNTGAGIYVCFSVGAGSTYTTTGGAWTSTVSFQATGSTSVVGTANATWFMTGAQLEIGSQATSFDFRSIGTELALCQRYTYVVGNTGEIIPFNGVARGLSTWFVTINTPVAMRSTPSLSITGGGTIRATYNGTEVNSSANSSTIGGAALEINFATSWANSNQILLDYYSISGATPAAGSAALALTFNYGSFIFSSEL